MSWAPSEDRVALASYLGVGIWARLQQVASLAQAHGQAHDQALPQGVNWRVGHLQSQRLMLTAALAGCSWCMVSSAARFVCLQQARPSATITSICSTNCRLTARCTHDKACNCSAPACNVWEFSMALQRWLSSWSLQSPYATPSRYMASLVLITAACWNACMKTLASHSCTTLGGGKVQD